MAIKLGTIYGIPLYLDYSWFIILALIIFELAFLVVPLDYKGLSTGLYLLLGVVSALLLFGSIVVHELAHSIIAKRNGLKIRRITLYLLGGVSEMSEEPPNPSLELSMSAAGPLTSLAIAGVSCVAWLASLGTKSPLIIVPLYYTFFFNLIVAAFNLIPAFPMDGGRVLRSLIWRSNGDIIRSTKISANVGRIFAYLLMFGGIVVTFLNTGLLFDGIWFVLIGWFISSSAQSEYRQVQLLRDVADLKARDMMSKTVDMVSPEITLRELSSQFLQYKHNGFPVMRGDELLGLVTMRDLRGIKREFWDTTKVSDIMTPKEKLVTVKESDPAKLVLSSIGNNRIGTVFVLSDDLNARLVGIITGGDIMGMIRMQQSFQKSAPPPAPAGSERKISVEVGMLFQIIAPEYGGLNWAPLFNPSEFSLVSEQIVQIASDKQAKQFTLQAMKKGTFYLSLSQHGDKKSSLMYTIFVN